MDNPAARILETISVSVLQSIPCKAFIPKSSGTPLHADPMFLRRNGTPTKGPVPGSAIALALAKVERIDNNGVNFRVDFMHTTLGVIDQFQRTDLINTVSLVI